MKLLLIGCLLFTLQKGSAEDTLMPPNEAGEPEHHEVLDTIAKPKEGQKLPPELQNIKAKPKKAKAKTKTAKPKVTE